MELRDFIEALYSLPAVEGHRLGIVEIDIGILEGEGVEPILVVDSVNPCATITITPQ